MSHFISNLMLPENYTAFCKEGKPQNEHTACHLIVVQLTFYGCIPYHRLQCRHPSHPLIGLAAIRAHPSEQIYCCIYIWPNSALDSVL